MPGSSLEVIVGVAAADFIVAAADFISRKMFE
jgi:hypothetical protein